MIWLIRTNFPIRLQSWIVLAMKFNQLFDLSTPLVLYETKTVYNLLSVSNLTAYALKLSKDIGGIENTVHIIIWLYKLLYIDHQ